MNRLRHQLVQDADLLAKQLVSAGDGTGDVAARMIKAGDNALLNRINPITKNDRDCIGRVLRCTNCKRARDTRNYTHLAVH